MNVNFSDKKAIIAMSGGVDSSVAAFLMQKNGYDCMGVTMKLFDSDDAGISNGHTCCSLEDVEDARSVARRLGMPYYVFNFSDCFNAEVIDKFIGAYESGETPNPCIDCNRFLKFDKLYRRAAELDIGTVATGHYASVGYDEKSGRWLLKRAADREKDQSYVLYALTQEQLAYTVFPLGGLTKAEVRLIAEQNGFANAHKHDSQDICFVPDGDYASFIRRRTGKHYPTGNFVLADGTVLGRSNGVISYTVGQRRGLGISYKTPLYVCDIDPVSGNVTLGGEDELYSRVLYARDVNLISVPDINGEMHVTAAVRYRGREEKATVTAESDGTVRLVFEKPQRAVAKGQAVVMYDGKTVVGGGTICEIG